MRRFLIVLAIATSLAAGAIGHAEGELATCTGSAPGDRACTRTFTISGTTAVDLRMVPAVGYTGSIKARIIKGTATVATVGAYFVGGQATPIASNLPVEYTQILDSGQYKLIVDSAKTFRPCGGAFALVCGVDQPLPDAWAAGGFGAEVVPTDATAA